MFQQFVDAMKSAFQFPLPGKQAQNRFKPYLKINPKLDVPPIFKPKYGAVMALLYPRNEIPHILLIERPKYEGVHSGQIAFPGGQIESSDASHLVAAIRETYEEIGVEEKHIEVLGNLSSLYVLASNFMVYPFVGILQELPPLTLERNEVASVLEIPIYKFFEKNIIKEKEMKSALGIKLHAPYFDLDGKILWGATAMMVSELCAIIEQHKIKIQ
ncbi:MAG: CoA pyrophosphatase [Chitinophagales bacterium]|nr:CoA pyrophosphatase [Bacteroidota bacterium]